MAESRRYSLTMPLELRLTPAQCSRDALCNALPRIGLVVVLGVLALSLGASSASASSAEYNGISADGSIVVFSSDEQLVSGDADHERDVYQRSYDETLERYVTREISIGPTGGNDALPAQFDAISEDGNTVFFSTKEPLTAADTDQGTDIYKRDLGTNMTTLVSRGADSCEAQGCGNGNLDANFVPGGLTPNGEELFFITDERLIPLIDTDSSPDIYMREIPAVGAPRTILVSQAASDCGSCGNGAFTLSFNAVSPDGSTVVFSTSEHLADADEDALQDVYARDLTGEATQLVSTPRLSGCPGVVDCKAVYGGVSNTGSHIFFESREQISSEDHDESQDVYDWSTGAGAVLASIGPDGGNGDPLNVTYKGSRSDGSAVFFLTSERLDSTADTDDKQDVYERSGSTTTLVSTGPAGGNGSFNATLNWISPDGSNSGVLFSTEEQLTIQDQDSSLDVYERNGGITTLISPGGSAGSNASFAGASADGSHVFFITSESLVAKDKDTSPDIYEQVGSTTNLVSTGPEGGNGNFGSGLNGVSVDGMHAFLTTTERLTPDDPDAEVDVYDRSDSETRLVSIGNSASLGPVTPTLTATNPKSPGATTTPTIIGQAEPDTWIKLYKTFDCSGEPTAQGTSAELAGGLLVSVIEGSTTSFRATAEANGLVSPCSAPIAYKQEVAVPPPPPPGEEPSTGGSTGTSGSGTSNTGTGGGKGGTRITYVMPETLITFGPAAKTHKKKIIFGFTDATGQPGSSFVCKLDHRRWKGCSSPTRLTKLKLGRHTFSVKAVNAIGTAEEQPTKRRFKVVR